MLSYLLLCVACFVGDTTAHVALTYPPARKYDLDFLDNGRTKAPCGMPKGDLVTSLPAASGAMINVTWHLAYPHRGGFKLQLLDEKERYLMDLTPTNAKTDYVGSDDTTAQSYTVSFPESLTCKGCTLRLLRQAQEWGNQYLFWSCADVDIVPVTELTTVCSGHGKINAFGQCQCDHLYSGVVCQYKDECWIDNDCGLHGKCINIDATTYPKRQCYCEIGWFGDKCSKESPVKDVDIDVSKYNKQQLSDDFVLFWRIIPELEEIEVLLRTKGTSYAAVGWRPHGITQSCKSFPIVQNRNISQGLETTPRHVTHDSNKQSILHSSNERHAFNIHPEPASETDPKSKAEPEPESEPQPKPVLRRRPKPEPTAENNAEPEPKPEGKAEPEPKPEGEAEPEPKGESKSEPEPKAESNAEPEPKAESNAEPEPKIENKVEPEPKAESSAEPESKIENKAEPEPKAESSAEPEPKIENKAEPEAESKTEPEPNAESKAEPEPKADSKAEPEPAAESKAEPEPKAEVKAEPEPESEGKSEPQPKVEAEPQSDSETKPGKKITPKPKEEAKPEPEPKSEPEPPSHHNSPDSDVLIKDPVHPAAEPEATIEPSSTHEHRAVSSLAGKLVKRSLLDLHGSSSDPMFIVRTRRQITIRTSDFIIPSTKPEPILHNKKEHVIPEPLPETSVEQSTVSHSSVLETLKPEPKAEVEPEPKGESTKTNKNVAKHNYPERTPFTPRADFHAMDCSDIVIGMARGSLSRIQDFYTRDRSTPHVDSYFGGKDDITAALGYEVDGTTTILFRKKLKAMDLTDHTITNAPMDVIWARGQEPDMYVHFPSTGLEAGKAKIKDFYRPDELKYHGHRNQRGKLTLNFYDEKTEDMEQSDCQGGWKYPANCQGKECEYSIKWKFLDTTDEISFTITSIHADRWTGVGFSKNQIMPETDAVIGWVDHMGNFTILDVWMSDYVRPRLDNSQDIYNMSGKNKDGVTTLHFVRKRLNIDIDNDVHFSDTDCPYLIFPVNGGTFNAISKKIAKHLKSPIVSSERICIRKCQAEGHSHEQVGKPVPESEPEPGHDIKTIPEPTVEPEPKPKTESLPHAISEPEPKSIGGRNYISQCLGEWKSPPDCEGHNCEYKANWFYRDETDEIIFTISSKSYNKWTGIGFSRNRKMAETDAVIGWIQENGQSFIMDTWLKDYSPPIPDSIQNIHNASGQRVDGMTVLQFVRKRGTNDAEKDLQFTNECLYFIFPTRGGIFNSVNKKIRKHESSPIVSDKQICIQSCNSKAITSATTVAAATTITTQPTTERSQTTHLETFPSSRQVTTSSTSVMTSLLIPTTQPPAHFPSSKYAIEIKLRQAGKSELKNEKSQQYLTLQKRLMEEMKMVLQSLGPQNVEFAGFESGESEQDVIAQMHVTLPDKVPMKEGRQLSADKSDYKSNDLRSVLNATVNSGKVGSIPVDPAYLKIVYLAAVQDKSPTETAIEQESSSNDLSDEQVKIYIIISGVLALVFLVIVQAACMIYRDRRAKRGSHTKEKLLNNSHWRDYSVTASSNYSYENFAMQDDENKISKHPIGSVLNGSGMSKGSTASQPTNGLGLPRVGPPDRMLPRNAGYSATFERMAMRRNNGPAGASVPPSYATHDRSLRSMTGSAQSQQELRPDFYFMPHQRRYSGEVVRVFVDYNNPEYTGK